jgi:2-dehydro-3-deoxygluconokinase
MARIDMVGLGEVMLRMAPPRFERLRRTTRLDVVVAGAQLNVCAAMARLGRSTTFLTALPANDLGTLAVDTCRAHGVDMSHVLRPHGARMGLNFLEFAVAPRAPLAIFDRAGSAASTIDEHSFDWRRLVAGARYAHTDGIFPGVGTGTLAATRAFLAAAREAGAQTTFDLNYRQHVWSPHDARAAWEQLLPLVDVLVASPGVAQEVFGYNDADEDLARRFADTYGIATVLVTRREIRGGMAGRWSSLGYVADHVIRGRPVDFEVIDRFGTGDAFLAGYLHAVVDHGPEDALHYANAACALAHTVEGDVLQASHEEVLAIMHGDIDLRVRR